MPVTPIIGVRISWLIAATKLVLASLASRARDFARAQSLLELLDLAQVGGNTEIARGLAGAVAHGRSCQQHRDMAAVLFDQRPFQRLGAGLDQDREQSIVGLYFSVQCRGQLVGHLLDLFLQHDLVEAALSDHFLGAVAGQLLGERIEAGEATLQVHRHDGHAGGGEQRALEHFALLQAGAHLFGIEQLIVEFVFKRWTSSRINKKVSSTSPSSPSERKRGKAL